MQGEQLPVVEGIVALYSDKYQRLLVTSSSDSSRSLELHFLSHVSLDVECYKSACVKMLYLISILVLFPIRRTMH